MESVPRLRIGWIGPASDEIYQSRYFRCNATNLKIASRCLWNLRPLGITRILTVDSIVGISLTELRGLCVFQEDQHSQIVGRECR